MPIKLPKAFPRRKSAGNALEDSPIPTQSSFRVLERPSNKSFEGPETLRRISYARPLSASQLDNQPYSGDNNNLNVNNRYAPNSHLNGVDRADRCDSGSGGTNNSGSSGGHDNSSASARFSSSSTLPSSTDVPIDDTNQIKNPYRMAAPPVPESSGIASLKAAGRAFSFGRRKAESQALNSRPAVEHTQTDGRAYYARERALTETSHTSESTATPPKLLDGGLGFGSTDNFGRMFEDFGKRQSQIDLPQGGLGIRQTESPGRLSPTDDPRDGMAPPHLPAMERTYSYEKGDENFHQPPRPLKSNTMPLPSSAVPTNRNRQPRPPSAALRRSSGYGQPSGLARDSPTSQDPDSRLFMDSMAISRRLDRAASGGYQDSDDEDNPTASLVPQGKHSPSTQVTAGAQYYSANTNRQIPSSPGFDPNHRNASPNPWQESSTNSTPRAKRVGLANQDERSMFDASPPLPGERVPPPRQRIQPPPKLRTQNKIMTPTQFERYRKEQEINQAVGKQSINDESDEEADDYEDDDEVERNKQLAKERRKQEAHLAVYRQQMMKVTGEQSSDSPNVQLRPSMDRASMSAPNVQNRASSIEINFDKPSDDGERGSDEEDEDVPLGVLAAHGFPSKTRPPTSMSANSTKIQYKSESYPPPPASTSGASQGGRASGLPPFARHLPQDPYYGASLVNSPNRESLAMGHQGPPSVAGSIPPHVPPAGLVGVIAGMGQMPGMPPGMPPIMSPGERATVQMSEQMSQMMQMQMQWMQQMQQMMSSGMQLPPGQVPPMMPGPPGMMMPPMMPPGYGQPARPASSGPPTGNVTPGGQAPGSRAMSMMGAQSWHPPQPNNRQSFAPSVMSGGLAGGGPGYTPSLAPSERSNVGLPSRYRPVSIAPADEHNPRAHSRTSTLNSNTLHPGALGRDSRLSSSQERKSNLSLRPISQAQMRKSGSDDDDEEGWEEMKKNRDKKKSKWRLNRKKDEQAEPGLEYYEYTDA
ncbi:uncharacterized protein KY384_009146 [Bacidia gigantensis]|uniref:uncharacterized protein n=1 Tax=Bacidia gigantensis TaxID=2732470 RepID=UPI001D04E587|nr:uncharacterized protein KY384_009146 [Bacidia gigantensis]KAG8525502.1 hypothetical protein KY384_009146 [Bacidia gigantensis]